MGNKQVRHMNIPRQVQETKIYNRGNYVDRITKIDSDTLIEYCRGNTPIHHLMDFIPPRYATTNSGSLLCYECALAIGVCKDDPVLVYERIKENMIHNHKFHK